MTAQRPNRRAASPMPALTPRCPNRARRMVKIKKTGVDWLHLRGAMTDRQYGAAVWYRTTSERAGVLFISSSRWDGPGSVDVSMRGPEAILDAQAHNRNRLRKCREAIPPRLLDILDRRVVFELEPDAERTRHQAGQDIVALRLALDVLADWLGGVTPGKSAEASAVA
jgi:hypothetical protein